MTLAELPQASAPPAVRSHRAPLAALIVLCVLMIRPNPDNSKPCQGDETWCMVSALTMIDGGDSLAPSWSGEYRFNKPILFLACLTILATCHLATLPRGDRAASGS